MAQSAVLAWAVGALCPSGRVIEVRDLHDGVGPWLVRCSDTSGSECAGILRVAGEREGKDADYVRTEAAALRVLEQYGISAPRLVDADLTGEAAGRVASLQTVLDGEAVIRAAYDSDRLRSVGAQLARIHRAAAEPSTELPLRRRALEGSGEGFLAERRQYAGSPRWADGERQLQAAATELARHPMPRDRFGLVHGDAWLGNAMATAETGIALFDWGCAGVGHPGVDVGYTRLSAVLTYRLDAAADVLAGWVAESGGPLNSLPYWDVAAALTTPPNLGPATDRRDEFLVRALDELGSRPSGTTANGRSAPMVL